MGKFFSSKEGQKSGYDKVAHLAGAAQDLIKLAEKVDITDAGKNYSERDALDIVLEKYKNGDFDHLTTKQMVSMLFDDAQEAKPEDITIT